MLTTAIVLARHSGFVPFLGNDRTTFAAHEALAAALSRTEYFKPLVITGYSAGGDVGIGDAIPLISTRSRDFESSVGHPLFQT
jgi:hypothetical protein